MARVIKYYSMSKLNELYIMVGELLVTDMENTFKCIPTIIHNTTVYRLERI